ncbi:serine carboxypeptidase [Salix suchowensis]|nr:serine carboxypeptidase [Salix suchowensis]
MGKHCLDFLCLLVIFCFPLLHSYLALAAGTDDGSEQWGYVEVRPAHLFWWHYKSPHRVQDPAKPWPDEAAVVGSDEEAAADLAALLEELFNGNQALQKSTLYIFAESYGGKFAATLGVSALKAIEAGELKLQLGGVALGDSWISPEDFVFTWGPLLKDLSRMNSNGLNSANSLAVKIQKQLAEGKYEDATSSWSELEHVVLSNSNNVDFYNFLLDYVNDPIVGSTAQGSRGVTKMNPSPGSIGVRPSPVDLHELINGPIRRKLKIIPENVTWDGQGGLVFQALIGDFMKPRIQELLAKGINVTIYNGQLDLICSTKGAEAWVNKLKWDGLQNFLSLDRSPLSCRSDNTTTKGFTSSYKNLFFYWILGAGHFVPAEQPCISLQMVGNVTKSPNNF